MKKTVYDVEVSPTKAMVGFMDIETGKVKQFQHSESAKIKKYIKKRELIGFNSRNYDDIILDAMIDGESAKSIYNTSFGLIEGEAKRWDYRPKVTSIDLIEVAPGQASLKLYGARLGTKQLQDLPYDPHEKHSKKMWQNVMDYNINDLQMTKELYEFLLPQLELREQIGTQYGFDAMSKGEAQIATGIYNELLELKKLPKQKLPNNIDYVAPDYIKFESPELQELLNKLQYGSFEVGKGGSPIVPKWLKDTQIIVDDVEYTVQIGGIHSVNKSEAIVPKDDEVIIDTDVNSLYPSLMIQNKFYPEQISKRFGDVFEKIYIERRTAKHNEAAAKKEMKKRGLI